MNNPENILMSDNENAAKLFDESSLAFDLINNGKEQEASDEFPFESHFIKKYVSTGLSELTELLKLRMELH